MIGETPMAVANSAAAPLSMGRNLQRLGDVSKIIPSVTIQQTPGGVKRRFDELTGDHLDSI
jgi:hypothetical protein